MVGCLNGDDIGAEVRSQEEHKGLNNIRLFGFATREAQLGELLVRVQHDQFGAKDHSSLLLLVVIDLDGCVVRNSEGDQLCLVSFGTSCCWFT